MTQKRSSVTQLIHYTHSLTSERTDRYALHCHTFYEIYFFLSGNVHYLVEGQSYIPQPDSILLIPAGSFHGVKINTTEPYERYALHFLPELLSPEYRKTLLSPFHREPLYLSAAAYPFRECCDFLLECNSMPEKIQQIAIRCRTEALLTQLYCMCHAEEGGADSRTGHYSVQEIIKYINDHITGPVSLSAVMDHFYISKNHLNLLFKQATGTTVGNYITYKRTTLARLSIMEGQSASGAALAAGFQDYSTFFRSYRRIYGHSPTDNGHSPFHAPPKTQ